MTRVQTVLARQVTNPFNLKPPSAKKLNGVEAANDIVKFARREAIVADKTDVQASVNGGGSTDGLSHGWLAYGIAPEGANNKVKFARRK